MSLIEIVHLSKIYKKAPWLLRMLGVGDQEKTILRDISFSIQAGEIVCLLGKNGSGKTTLLKILSTLILPTEGKCFIEGKDIFLHEREVKKNLAYIYGDERSFFWRLSIYENLRFFAILRGIEKTTLENTLQSIMNICQIESIQKNPVNVLSAGERQKLSFARGLLGSPKILFMDEVTRSLDPPSAKHIREFIKNDLRNIRKCAVIFATHNMTEAEEMADRVLVIDSGQIIAQGKFEQVYPQLEKIGFV